MAQAEDISYIRSSVNFTSISTMDEIYKNHSIRLTWDIELYADTDITKLYVLRAILDPNEMADYSDPAVRKKFRTIYSWERESDSDKPATELVDKFEWSNNEDNNLHNLNYNRDPEWNERKFRRVIRRICAGEQGVLYKIYGYSRRMNRGATPMGFFCDGSSIVALSQKNQMINDRWYGECGQVWKATIQSGNFVRVAVDMNRDLGENAKKERRVWASTDKGSIYCFDYWTGRVIGSVSLGSKPIYAIAYDAVHNMLLSYDGTNKIAAIYEDSQGKITEKMRKGPFPDFNVATPERVVGAVCTNERVTGVPTSYFYVIYDKEAVLKLKVTSSNITVATRIKRGHFGCNEKNIGKDPMYSIVQTPANRNNIYGIGFGINGQVWVNGHTPLTVSSVKRKSAGNPIKIRVRPGRLCRTTGTQFVNGDTSNGHAYAIMGKAVYENLVEPVSGGYWETSSVMHQKAVTATVVGHSTNAILSENQPNHASQHYGYNLNRDQKERNKTLVDAVAMWDWCASPEHRTMDHVMWDMPGCKFVWATKARAVHHINWTIDRWNSGHRPPAAASGGDIRAEGFGHGTKITEESLKKYPWAKYIGMADGAPGGAADAPSDIIHNTHIEIIAIEDDIPEFEITRNSMLQDLNYFYGCTQNENLYDTNGQFEDMQNISSTVTNNTNYRRAISASNTVSIGKNYFTTTTRWRPSRNKDSHSFGFAGYPYTLVGKYKDTINNTPNEGEKSNADYNVSKPAPFNMVNHTSGNSDLRSIFLAGTFTCPTEPGVEKTLCEPGQYKNNLPMSIGSICCRMPSDGRMVISQNDTEYYGTPNESKRIKYEMVFADRREGKIGILPYDREADYTPSTNQHKATGHRLNYVSADIPYKTTNNMPDDQDSGNAVYLPGSASNLNGYPYHVAVDSDNNLWYTSNRYLGKFQLLDTRNKNEKYLYDPKKGNKGLYPYENNNFSFETSLVYLNKYAQNGAYYDAKPDKYPNGIKNGEGGITNSVYNEATRLLNSGSFPLTKNNLGNNAYVYSATPFNVDEDGKNVWKQKKLFGVNNRSHYYTDSRSGWNAMRHDPKGTVNTNYVVNGNMANEFNSDNFGMSCLLQKNEVEMGPDIIHPVPMTPTAKSRISEAYSMSNDLVCDVNDGSGYWDAHTSIFNDDWSASGYDDLSTTHYIYDIERNYRRLIFHRYEYNDPNLVGVSTRKHSFDDITDEEGDIIYPERVIDNYKEGVWLTPNYIGMVPPYAPLNQIPISREYHPYEYYVDLYIDYNPSVYNLGVHIGSDTYETIHVGHHTTHVFERWPTNKFCIRGIGTSEYTDTKTDYDLVGKSFWGECENDLGDQSRSAKAKNKTAKRARKTKADVNK